jgi:hypothetical protein
MMLKGVITAASLAAVSKARDTKAIENLWDNEKYDYSADF